MEQCSITGCERPKYCRGWCSKHYNRWHTHGDPLVVKSRITKSPEERFWARVNKQGPVPDERPDLGPCWVWTGPRNKQRGQFSAVYGRSPVLTHRFCYELCVGPIPEGLVLDHLCRNRACCNPDHLEPVTAAENTRRNEAPSTVTNRTGVCQYGHPIEGDNVYSPASRNERSCRECKRRRQRESWARTRAVAGPQVDQVG